MATAAELKVLYISVPRERLAVFRNKYLNLVETFYWVSLESTGSNEGDTEHYIVNFKYAPENQHSANEVVSSIQRYVEWSLGASQAAAADGGEDSSYDSDHEAEAEGAHRAASRTPSDTLAAEFAEHVTLARPQLAAPRSDLRHVVIDGSNVAMCHGNKDVFSSRGIEICVEWFRARGHTDITVFVPMWRKEQRADNPVVDRDALERLERERVLVYTPSRLLAGKRLVCYDDRYVLRLAADVDGVVVSNDNYRDLAAESADFRRVLDERLLMYTFVGDRFMPPEDPLGRTGPTLDAFLSTRELPPVCPYDRRCTYGNKCKYYHPERAPRPPRAPRARNLHTLSLPPPPPAPPDGKRPLARAHSAAPRLPDATLASNFDRAQMQPPAHRVLPPAPPDSNSHRKLARQLTLNPSGDARLGHAAAARVASAPAGARAAPPGAAAGPGAAAACASESALPLWEARRRMHYHLSGIFPEAQVAEAMAAFPEETDAQNMCAIILARYRRELPDYRR